MLSYDEARQKVIEVTGTLARGRSREISRETLDLPRCWGRVLAQSLTADRDYPPFDRSSRDGFAVRSWDATVGAELICIGESKAGCGFSGAVGSGQCVEIMTGAAMPAGADAVVMVEHARFAGGRATLDRGAAAGQNYVPRGNEARAGQEILGPGARMGVAEMALAAQVGLLRVPVFRRPRAALLSTGDEVVDMAAQPGPLQIRNSNGLVLETLAALAGAEPVSLGNAPDEHDALRRLIERGLEEDVLVLSGGVSKGKYDLVKAVFAELGAETYFESVAIRPGQPAVFGSCRGKPIFGLPGNPISTLVTFELFVVPAIEILSGTAPQPLPLLRAHMAHPLQEKAALTRFLPAVVSWAQGEPHVTVLRWQGSGDLAGLAKANAFLVVPAEKPEWVPGEWAMVLLRRGFGGGWC